MQQIVLSPRLRATPFTPRVTDAGVKAYTVYNHMLLPAMFASLHEDCQHLKTAVQVWDVSCERQVEISGPDAATLTQLLTPRDLSAQKVGQCVYSPTVDADGRILNDPVTLKLDEDRFWVSVADSDVILFAKGLAVGSRLNVRVTEPDVHPLAIQGPYAMDLATSVFGEAVRDLRFFRFVEVEFGGRSHIVARSGYSMQGGVEIYLNGSDLGIPLWDALMEAGRQWDVRPGCPNLIERIEGGLLSYGSDMTTAHSPYEAGLGKYCNPHKAACIGSDALAHEHAYGPDRIIRYLTVEGDALPSPHVPYRLMADGTNVGQITSATFSPDYDTNIAIGMLEKSHWDEGTAVMVETPLGPRQALVHEKPIAASSSC